MEMRVVVPDATSVTSLAEQLCVALEMWLGERSCILGRRALVETWH